MVFQVGNVVRRAVTTFIVRRGQPPSAASASHAAITVRIRDIERGVDEGVLAGFRAIANLVPLFVALIALSSKLSIFAIALLAPFALLLRGARRLVRGYHARSMRLAEDLHQDVDALCRHLDLWRTYGAADRVLSSVDRAGVAAGVAAARADATKAALSGVNEVLAAAALLGVVVLIERLDVNLGSGSLVAFAAVFFLTYRPIRDLGDARTTIERAATSLEALENAVGVSPEGSAPVSSATTAPKSVNETRRAWRLGRLEIQGARFAPDGRFVGGGRPLFFTVEPGRVVALVGPTGSGKTTMLRGLLGLSAVIVGAIQYDGQDLTKAGVGPSERPFAWVPQEGVIVPGTIEENVALGAEGQTPEEIKRALEEVGAGSLAEARKGAILSAGGHELSGGERQLVALARAVASGLPVLLLDEPTSGLDAEAEERVIEALARLRGSRSIVIVTHRPGPLRIADRVISLEDIQDEPGQDKPSQDEPGPDKLGPDKPAQTNLHA